MKLTHLHNAMLFRKGELKLLWPFYLSLIIEGLSMVITPFIVLYFVNLGFTYFQVSIIISAYGLSMALFEVPTSAFADGYSRKYSIVIGFIIIAITFALIPLTTNFYLIVLLHILGGIGMTFRSGAEEALVVDNLNKEGRNDLHHEYFIKEKSFLALGFVFAPLLGALLVKAYSIKILWFVFAFGFFLNSIITIVFVKEHFISQKIKATDLIKKSYSNGRLGLMFSIRNKVVFFSILAGLSTKIMLSGTIGFQQFFVNFGMTDNQLGYLYSFAAGVGIIASFLSRFLIKYSPKNIMSIVVLITMVLFFSLIFVHPPYLIIACAVFIIQEGMLRLGEPIYQTYLHTFIPGRIRASSLSANSMVSQFIYSITSLFTGALIDIFGPQKVLSIASLFGIIAIFFYQKIKA